MNNQKAVNLARQLRRNQTDAEQLLWSKLWNIKLDGIKFRRQQPLGEYIVDFISFDKKLIIEIDGGQHNEDEIKESDERRTKWLEGQGYCVIRFWNHDVLLNIEGVVETIRETLE